ncbi:B-cell lymphoma/leukemia 10 [Engraulis encrasicolus]|uniref:B-cell lymphoma/leukemia 10 n=1 Tax=Engraulis encrasicolus TaxID=184585 RepID=UPI002FD567D2
MDFPHLTEDDMADIKKEALERLRPYLVDKIIANRHFDYLRSKRILTRDDTEEINCKNTDRKRAGKLLDCLAENPLGLDTLIESIRRERTINFLITKITDEVQKVKDEKIAALKAESCCTSSSSTYSPTKPGPTTDPSRTFSSIDCYASTALYHPEGERSPSQSVVTSSLNLFSGSAGGRDVSSSSVCCAISASSVSSYLPKPGDPGAPPLPEEVLDEAQDTDSGAGGSNASGGDANFQPLRSRSVSPRP